MNKKWLIGIFIVAPLLIALGIAGIGKSCCGRGGSNQLEILRGNSVSNALGTETILENGLIKKTIFVPLRVFQSNDKLDLSKDPFAEPTPTDTIKISDPKKVLESSGITFGKGALAIYNKKTFELTVINTREQLDFIEFSVQPLDHHNEKQIAIRAEIYEMPSLTALEVIESAATEGTHTPERNALRKMLGRGKVRLVNAITIIARSGQRAKVEDTQDFPLLLSKTDSIEKEDENGNRPDWEIRQIGTLFEVDPVLGADNFTIDLNFSLEHHTAAPDLRHTKSAYPPTLHAKQVTTQITTQDGASILVGSWKPTGKPEYEKNDLMHLIFITANVQTPTAPVPVTPTLECCAKK